MRSDKKALTSLDKNIRTSQEEAEVESEKARTLRDELEGCVAKEKECVALVEHLQQKRVAANAGIVQENDEGEGSTGYVFGLFFRSFF